MQPQDQRPSPTDNKSLEKSMFQTSVDMQSEPDAKKYRRKIMRNEFTSLLIMILLGIGIGLTLSKFVFRPYRVVGESMSQTLHTGDRLIVNRLGKSVSSLTGDSFIPKRHEIIVFESPFNGELLVKRVIGLPGERVVVAGGQIVVYNEEFPNGFDPDEGTDYEENLPAYTTGNIDIEVTEDHIFVSGDNRTPNGSSDSRNELGLVPVDTLIGNVSMRILPLNQAEFY